MRTMRLDYDPPALQRLLDATGGLPNLISIACAQIIAALDSETRTITGEMVEHSLNSEPIKMALLGWDELAGDDAATRRLARIVVFGTLAQPSFSQAEIMQKLNLWQLAFEPVQLERLLKWLELAFVLGNDGGKYFYRLPLFVEQLKAGGEPEIRLQNEIDSCHPLLLKLQADARLLNRLPPQTLLGLLPVLLRTRQLERILQAAGVHRSHFDLTLAFARADAPQRAKLLGERLFLKPKICDDGRLFCLTLGDNFPLNIEKLYLFFPAADKPAQARLSHKN